MDPNVFSELVRPGPEGAVKAWVESSEAFFADFAERILPFGETAAMYYATLKLATRTGKDFEHLGLAVIDPRHR